MTDQSSQQQLNRFIDQLDRYGDEIDSWPAADAAEARGLIAQSPAARQALAEARTLANALADLPQLSAPSELLTKIAQRPSADRWEQLQLWFQAALWRPLLAGAMPLVAGFVLGFVLAPETDDLMVDEFSLLTLSSELVVTDSELEEYDYDL